MDYQTFSSDLSLQRSIAFGCIEENEEYMLGAGVDQRARQQGRGQFTAHLCQSSVDDVTLFADRFSTALTMHVALPSDTVGLLLPRSAGGQFLASGQNVADNSLLFFSHGAGSDLVGPDLFGSEALTMPEARFIEMREAICPGLYFPEGLAIMQGDTASLQLFRQAVLKLMASAEPDKHSEQLSYLLATMLIWMAHATQLRGSLSNNTKRVRVAKQAQEFIEANYREKVPIENLCRATGVGVRTLQRSFCEYFDQSVTDYLKSVRLDSARRELMIAQSGQYTVAAIATRNGFNHLGRFSVEFRQHFGELPKNILARNFYSAEKYLKN